MNTTNDLLWTWDMIEELQADLSRYYPKLKIMKTRILKDLFIVKKSGTYRFQLDFIEQDIVFFDHIMDITEFMNMSKINIQNQAADFTDRIVIPRVILNMHFATPDQRELEKQFKIEGDIKSIFPQCKYLLLFRYKGDYIAKKNDKTTNQYDKIVYFSKEKMPEEHVYKKGEVNVSKKGGIKNKYDDLIRYLIATLKNDNLNFMA